MANSYLLTEAGGYLLQENGSRIVLEYANAGEDEDGVSVLALEDGIMAPPIRDRSGSAFVAVTSTPTALELEMPQGARLVVTHYISGAATGGYVSLTHALGSEDDFVPHHGDAQNAKGSNTTSSYSTVYRNCMPTVKLALNIVDGTHTVKYSVLL